jgi:hypothetical protein
MTGAYLRVQRDGKWMSLEVEHLTNEEREEKLTSDHRLIQWLNLACRKLVECESLLNDLEKDGVIERQ